MCKRAMYLACMRVHLLVNCTTEHNSISNVNYAVSSRKSHLKGIQCFDLMLDYDKWIIWISGVVGISNNLHNYAKKNNLNKQTFFSPTKVFDGNEFFDFFSRTKTSQSSQNFLFIYFDKIAFLPFSSLNLTHFLHIFVILVVIRGILSLSHVMLLQ